MHERRLGSLAEENCSRSPRGAEIGVGRDDRATCREACPIARARLPAGCRQAADQAVPADGDRGAMPGPCSGERGGVLRDCRRGCVARSGSHRGEAADRVSLGSTARDLFFPDHSGGLFDVVLPSSAWPAATAHWAAARCRTRDVASPLLQGAPVGARYHEVAGYARVNSKRIKHLRLVRGPKHYKRQSRCDSGKTR